MAKGARRWWILAGLAATGMAGVIGIRVGVELTRRWPIESLERVLDRFSISLRSIEPWERRARAPHPRFEAMAAVVGGRVLVLGGFHNLEIQATTRVDEYDPTTDSWRRLGDLPVAVTHANAAVANGEVWVAGGFLGDHPGPATDQTWRYDPETDRWRAGPRLPAPRGGGALLTAPDGALHYFGGWLPDRHTDSPDHWRLAPGDSIWTAAAPFPSPRGHMGAIALDGFLYAIGGCRTHDPFPIDLALVHRYDPATDTWAELAPLPEPRSHVEASTVAHQGRILVAGGRSNPAGKQSAAEVLAYDPATDSWSFHLNMPRGLLAPVTAVIGDQLFLSAGGEGGTDPRNLQSWTVSLAAPWHAAPVMPRALGAVAGAVIDRRLYLVGEGDWATLVFELGTGRWRDVDHASRRPIWGDHHAAEAIGGELYLLGGLRGGVPLDVVQVYDPRADHWRLGPTMPFPVGASATAIIGGKVYLAGGIVIHTTTRQAAVLDPATGVWLAIAPMPRARSHSAAGTDGRRLFVFGGRGPGSGDGSVMANGHDDVQIYDPATDTWTASGPEPGAPRPLPQGRGGMGKAVYLGGEFYVIGGESTDGSSARVDIYDPLRNAWREGPPMPTARHGIFPLGWGGGIWVAGGGVRAASSTSSIVEFFRPTGR